MRLAVVVAMLLIAGAAHAAAQQYQLSPASVAATNLKVQHNAVLVNTATGDIYTCIGTVALKKMCRDSPDWDVRKGKLKRAQHPKEL
jgi:hypothetical protein